MCRGGFCPAAVPHTEKTAEPIARYGDLEETIMMKRASQIAALAAGASLFAAAAVAEPNLDVTLEIDGEEIGTIAEAPDDSPFDQLISGWHFRTDETRALQTDDFDNPAFLAVDYGEELWGTVEGTENKSCASCHEDASVSMAGVRASVPKWNEAAGRPYTMQNFVNSCREERMGAEPWKWESTEMLGMTSFIAVQSRGMPVDVQIDGPMEEWFEKGKEIYYTRVGQLDMSCANCHQQHNGQMIRADHLSQGHSNGFPTYRLKWQGVGSLHRRFTGCMRNIRAVPYKRGSDEFVALELYLAHRGSGLAVESPSVRQ